MLSNASKIGRYSVSAALMTVVLIQTSACTGLHGGADGQRRHKAFPGSAAVEYERSVITIPIYVGNDETPTEELKLDAYMRLLREKPIRNSIDYRQFEFKIDAWELHGYSKALDGYITFTLSDTVQPKSICMATRHANDYPATIVYSAIYDVYLNEKRIVANQPGVAFAHGIRQIPPRGVKIAFEKPFDSERFRFDSGWCGGMRTITREEFEVGARQARAYRKQ